MINGANHPMGHGTGDLVGLDVCLAIMEVLHSSMAMINTDHISYSKDGKGWQA